MTLTGLFEAVFPIIVASVFVLNYKLFFIISFLRIKIGYRLPVGNIKKSIFCL